MDIDGLKGWIGKSETTGDQIQAFPSNALAATLNRDDPEYLAGSALPPLWHWLHFVQIFKLSEAGYDGHSALGGFLPPVRSADPQADCRWCSSRHPRGR